MITFRPGELIRFAYKNWRGERWFVGGPLSAFHEFGAYLDGPMHKECGTFALEHCPYLAAPNYARRIDARTIVPGTLSNAVILQDNTTIPDRPEVFVFACAMGYKLVERLGQPLVFLPKRPRILYACWKAGKKLEPNEYAPLIAEALNTH